MYKASLAPNRKGVSSIEMQYDNISETRNSADVAYIEKIDISKIADAKKFPEASGESTVSKNWSATPEEFQAWYNQHDMLLIETMIQSLGFTFIEIQKLDVSTGLFDTVKTNPSAVSE